MIIGIESVVITYFLQSSRLKECCTCAYVGFFTVFTGVFGCSGRRPALRAFFRYDPITDTWEQRAPLRFGRERCTALELAGSLYVIGGEINVTKAPDTLPDAL